MQDSDPKTWSCDPPEVERCTEERLVPGPRCDRAERTINTPAAVVFLRICNSVLNWSRIAERDAFCHRRLTCVPEQQTESDSKKGDCQAYRTIAANKNGHGMLTLRESMAPGVPPVMAHGDSPGDDPQLYALPGLRRFASCRRPTKKSNVSPNRYR